MNGIPDSTHSNLTDEMRWSLVKLSPVALDILDACRAVGGHPIIVGGAVRDALLLMDSSTTVQSVGPKDIDIEVFGDVDESRIIENLRLVARVDIAGESFRVMKLSSQGELFDLSLAPESSDFATACLRRDFTINAIGWDPESGEVLDPRSGRVDLLAGVINLVSSSSFDDDPLRVIRAAQFVARFGFALTPSTVAAARVVSDRFPEIARERVWVEWRKIACRGRYISRALAALVDTDWIRHFPALDATRGVEQDARWHAEGDVFTHLGLAADHAANDGREQGWTEATRELIVLAALLHDVGKPGTTESHPDGRITSLGHESHGAPIAEGFLAQIGSPTALQRRVGILVREHMVHASVRGIPSPAAVRRLVRRLDSNGTGVTINDWVSLLASDVGGRASSSRESPAATWLNIAAKVGPAAQPPLLRGQHLIARGFVPGPEFRLILAEAVRAQDDGVIATEAEAAAWLARRS